MGKIIIQKCPNCGEQTATTSEYFEGAFICENRRCSVIAFKDGAAFWYHGSTCTEAERRRSER